MENQIQKHYLVINYYKINKEILYSNREIIEEQKSKDSKSKFIFLNLPFYFKERIKLLKEKGTIEEFLKLAFDLISIIPYFVCKATKYPIKEFENLKSFREPILMEALKVFNNIKNSDYVFFRSFLSDYFDNTTSVINSNKILKKIKKTNEEINYEVNLNFEKYITEGIFLILLSDYYCRKFGLLTINNILEDMMIDLEYLKENKEKIIKELCQNNDLGFLIIEMLYSAKECLLFYPIVLKTSEQVIKENKIN